MLPERPNSSWTIARYSELQRVKLYRFFEECIVGILSINNVLGFESKRDENYPIFPILAITLSFIELRY